MSRVSAGTFGWGVGSVRGRAMLGALVAVWVSVATAASTLSVTVGDGGVSRLAVAPAIDVGVIAGPPSAVASRMDGSNGLVRVGMTEAKDARFDAGTATWSAPAAWGGLTVRLRPDAAGKYLEMAVSVSNASDRAIDRIDVTLLRLGLKELPSPKNAGLADDLGNPPATTLALPGATLALERLGEGIPVKFGFRGNDKAGKDGQWVREVGIDSEARDDRDQPPAIPAGKCWTVTVRLYGAAGAAALKDLTPEAVARFLARYPATLKWEDRRPIGRVFLASSAAQHKSATNPRGWFNEPKTDVMTQEGIARFGEELARRAVRHAQIARSMDGQGIIVWNLEGEEFPHAVSYIGDPRRLADFAPEMDAHADAYFQVLREAGLKAGLCIRPSRLEFAVDAATGKRTARHRNMGFDMGGNLIDKIAYAKKRWGATLFYLDTDVEWYYDRKGKPQGRLLDPETLRRVAAAHPDVLIIPEFMRTSYYAVAAGYGELRSHGFGNVTGTPPSVRDLYPRAMRVVELNEGDVAGRRAELVANLRHGDTVFFDSWWAPKLHAEIRALRQEAAVPGVPPAP